MPPGRKVDQFDIYRRHDTAVKSDPILGVWGYATPANSSAGYFTGAVAAGDFAVTGSKSAAVKDPADDSYCLLYCVESPEVWFEDFGEATFTAGKATVTLDPALPPAWTPAPTRE